LVNVTAGPDFSIGEAHEAMEYILQFTDADDADIIMGHVMKDSLDGEVQVTLLAAGMDPDSLTQGNLRDSEVFVQPTYLGSAAPQKAVTPSPTIPTPIQLDEIDIDIPTFLRRQKLGS
jgi:cell division protein FtsZ